MCVEVSPAMKAAASADRLALPMWLWALRGPGTGRADSAGQ